MGRPVAVLLLAGVVLSCLSLLVGGRVGWRDGPQLLAALEEQVVVYSWDADRAAGRLGPELLVVDGRTSEAHAAARPAGSVNIPFEERHDDLFQLPQGRQVTAVLVVTDDAIRARELAQSLFRQWGIPEVATFRGGWQAWLDAGLPRAEG